MLTIDLSTICPPDNGLTTCASILNALIHACFSPVQFRDEPDPNQPDAALANPDLMNGSSARAMNRLDKAAADWCALIANGHTPDPDHLRALIPSNHENLFYSALLHLPTSERDLAPWLFNLRKALTARCLLHINAHSHLAAAQGRRISDADLRIMGLLERINPIPEIARHRRSQVIAKITADDASRPPQTAIHPPATAAIPTPAPSISAATLSNSHASATEAELLDLLNQLGAPVPHFATQPPQTAKLPRPSRPGKQVKLRPKHALKSA